jgi:hypothetical protein
MDVTNPFLGGFVFCFSLQYGNSRYELDSFEQHIQHVTSSWPFDALFFGVG